MVRMASGVGWPQVGGSQGEGAGSGSTGCSCGRDQRAQCMVGERLEEFKSKGWHTLPLSQCVEEKTSAGSHPYKAAARLFFSPFFLAVL